MQGLKINKSGDSIVENSLDSINLHLLAQAPGMEIMLQKMYKKSIVWLSPSNDQDVTEFYYVLSGQLELVAENQTFFLEKGNSFLVSSLPHDVEIKVKEDAELLYIVNKPTFDDVSNYQDNLEKLMREIDEKDEYTYKHSVRVMNYCRALITEIDPASKHYNNLMTAALFHDVGKCKIPDDILGKKSRLNPMEFAIMVKHPLYSCRLLAPHFNHEIADIALKHHERLDGTGYPYGLSNDDLSLEVRILGVADSFDAMTSKRVYSTHVKSFMEASEELYNMPEKYDRKVTSVLLRLVQEGKLSQEKEGNHEGQ